MAANNNFLGFYRKNTTAKVLIGPFTRATNHYSVLTGLTTAGFTCYYSIGTAQVTGTYTTALNGPWSEILANTGYYWLWLSTLMTQAVGHGQLMFIVTSSGDPMSVSYQVIEQANWDSLIGGTGVDMLQVDMIQCGGASAYISTGGIQGVNAAFIGSSGASMASGLMATSRTLFNVVNKYIGSSACTFSSGVMATSVSAFNVINKYIGSSNTTFSSGTLSTSNSVFKVMVKNWGSSGTTVASGQMTTSLHAFNAVTLAVAASGTTVNSTFPWHQTSAQGFLADVRMINQATMSTRTGDNIEAAFYNANATATKIYNNLSTSTGGGGGSSDVNVVSIGGSTFTTRFGDNINAAYENAGATVTKIYNNLATLSSATLFEVNVVMVNQAPISTMTGDNFQSFFYNANATAATILDNIATLSSAGLSTLSTADLNNLSTFDVAEVVTIATAQLAGLSTLATANFNTMSVLTTANLNNVSTFGVSNVYDVLTHEELMKVVQARMLGDSTFDGTNLTYYDHAGTSFIGFAIATDDTVRTT